MKKFLQNFTKCILLFAALAVVLLYLNSLLDIHNYMGNMTMRRFYKEKEDTIDVLFLGSSHVFTDVNPAVLWDYQGISSFVLGSSNQAIWESYYNMVEAFKTQHPKLVAVELLRVVGGEEYEATRIPESCYGMKWSKNKIDAIRAGVPEDEFLTYLFAPSVYHGSYAEIKKENFWPFESKYGEHYKGFWSYFESTDFSQAALYDPFLPREEVSLLGKTEEYLKKMIDLAKEEDCEILFFVSPYTGLDEYSARYFDAAGRFAKENGVPFIDFNCYRDEIGLNLQCDYAENSHLSASGTDKYTAYIGNYLSENYDLPNHYGEEAYESWELNSAEWTRMKQNHAITKITNMNEYAEYLAGFGEGYLVVVSMEGMNSIKNQYLAQALSSLSIYDSETETSVGTGKETDGAKKWYHSEAPVGDTMYCYSISDGGFWILEDGAFVWVDESLEPCDSYYTTGSHSIHIQATVTDREDFEGGRVPSLDRYTKIDGTSNRLSDNGLNFLVYDKKFDVLVDKVSFDTLNGYMCVR